MSDAALDTLVFATDRKLQLEVRINGQILAQGIGFEGNLTGIEIAYDIETMPPSCSLSLQSVPSWVERGQPVEINTGYNGNLTRVFTGRVKRRRHGVRGSTIDCLGRTSRLTRPYRVATGTRAAKTFLAIGAGAAIEDILNDSGVDFTTANNERFEIDAAVNTFTLGTVRSIYMDMMSPTDMIRKIADVDGNRVFESRSGTLHVRPLLEAPAPSAFRTYGTEGIDISADITITFGTGLITSDDALGDAAARTRRSQSWKPTADGVISTISFWLKKVGNPTDSVVFELFNDATPSGTPGTRLLGGSADFNGQLLSTTTYEKITLAILSGTSVVNATQYHAVVRRTGANDAANYYMVGRVVAGGYGSGAPAVFNGTTWSAVTGDHAFDTVTSAYAILRLMDIADDEDEDQVKKLVVVRGAALEDTDAEGNTIQRQVLGSAITQDESLAQGDAIFYAMAYSNDLIQTDAKAGAVALRLLNKFHRILQGIEIEVPFDPRMDLGTTIGIIDPRVTGLSGNWWVRAYRHSLSEKTASTQISLFGGDQGGTTGNIVPRPDFDWIMETELVGNALQTVVTFDASGSADPGGKIVDYDWADDYTTPTNVNGPDKVKITVAYDPNIQATVNMTLTVTDDLGQTASITHALNVGATNPEIYAPVISCAGGNTCMATFDGGQSWRDIATPSGSARVTALNYNPLVPTDEMIVYFGTTTGRIYRSIDGMSTLVEEYVDADGDAITAIMPDIHQRGIMWATTTDRVLRSVDYGNTWVVWTNFNDPAQWFQHGAGHVNPGPTDPRPLNGIIGSEPSVNKIWVIGGRGDVVESWFGSNYIPDGGNRAWTSEIVQGDGPGAAARNALETVVSVVVSHATSLDVGLMFSRSGAGVPDNPYIYAAQYHPVGGANWQVGAGAMVAPGADGVAIAGNNLQLQQFLALLDNKTAYIATNGLAFWPVPNALPGTAGNRPHSLINVSAWKDVYLAAMDEGIAKSIDWGVTWDFFRPMGAPINTTWPAGAIGYQVAFDYRLPISVFDLAIITTSGAADATVENALAIRNPRGEWTDMGPLPTARSDNPHKLWYFPSLATKPYFFVRYTNSGAFDHSEDLYRSTDGTTWTLVLAKCGGVVLAANGTIWATAEDPANPGAFGAQPHAIYKSTDDGVTWMLVYSDLINSAGVYAKYLALAADPVDANRLMFAGQFPAASIITLTTLDATAPSPSFTRLDSGLDHEGASAFRVSPKIEAGQNGRWIMGFQVNAVTTRRIYTSDDDTLTWDLRLEIDDASSTFGFATIVRAGNLLYAGGSMSSGADGIVSHISSDNGDTWDALNNNASQIVGLEWDASNNRLYAITAGAGATRIEYLQPAAVGIAWTQDPATGLEAAMGYTTNCKMATLGIKVKTA